LHARRMPRERERSRAEHDPASGGRGRHRRHSEMIGVAVVGPGEVLGVWSRDREIRGTRLHSSFELGCGTGTHVL
jgi:hypothetical protein